MLNQSHGLANDIVVPSRADLERLGLFTPTMLAASAQERVRYIVEGLIAEKTLNIAVGASGLGKTPALVSLGIHIAAGKRWLGHDVTAGSVLYFDHEMSQAQFAILQQRLATHAGLPEVPGNFFAFSPNWVKNPSHFDAREALKERIAMTRPSLVIIDPLRYFFPKAEKGSDEMMEAFTFMRQQTALHDCAWLPLHHPRKSSTDRAYRADLATDPHAWFEEASGTLALSQNADLRLGFAQPSSGQADLVMSGWLRGEGPLTPTYLVRDYDGDQPVGYRQMTGVDTLKPEHRTVFEELAPTFRFKDVQARCGGSGGKADRLVKALEHANLVQAKGANKAKSYSKIQ